jgi:hypothetical protein
MPNEHKLKSFELNGEPVWVELQEVEAEDTGFQRAGRDGETSHRFETAIARIRPAAQAVLETLRELNTPKNIEIEFGIKFSGKIGAFIASADTDATFRVKLVWENPRPTPDESG